AEPAGRDAGRCLHPRGLRPAGGRHQPRPRRGAPDAREAGGAGPPADARPAPLGQRRDPRLTAASLPPLPEVVRQHGLMAAKGLGQHFLLDLNLTRRVARQAGDLAGQDVIEIGPGPGGLTRALLEGPCRRVIAVEQDPRCLPALAELAATYPGRLEVIEGDALALPTWTLGQAPRQVVANLP